MTTTERLINKFVSTLANEGIEASVSHDWRTYEERYLDDNPPVWCEFTFYANGKEFCDTVYDGDDYEYDIAVVFECALNAFGFVSKSKVEGIRERLEYYKREYRNPSEPLFGFLYLKKTREEYNADKRAEALEYIKRYTLELLKYSKLKVIDF